MPCCSIILIKTSWKRGSGLYTKIVPYDLVDYDAPQLKKNQKNTIRYYILSIVIPQMPKKFRLQHYPQGNYQLCDQTALFVP